MFELLQDYVSLPSVSWTSALAVGALGVVIFSSVDFVWMILRPRFSPMRALKGPSGGSLFFGHLKLAGNQQPVGAWHRAQLKKYGHVLCYKGFMNQDRLLTTDLKAIQHILTNSAIYHKPYEARYSLSRLLGRGLLFAEGNEHRRQRRIMASTFLADIMNLSDMPQNPAFGTLNIRDMTEIFLSKSAELCAAMSKSIGKTPGVEQTRLNMLEYLSSTTLDIIGLAGFHYRFNSIKHLAENQRDDNELAVAFSQIFSVMTRHPLIGFLKDRKEKQQDNSGHWSPAHARKKAALLSSGGKAQSKDLLTLLIKANLTEANDGTSIDRSMTDEEVMNQIPTFLVAGHETTSTATTWALYTLSTRKDIQNKLRDELSAFPHDAPTMDELNSLPYLDRFVREALRYHSVVSGTVRVAVEDDIIPLDKPFEDRFGKLHSEIVVKKGDTMMIPIRVINTLEEIWGPDAEEFNPDRWIDPPEQSGAIPSSWGNQLSFLGGPRSCIGFRFAVVEMKALLFLLVRSFEFELGVPADEIIGSVAIVTRPTLKSNPGAGGQMPIWVRRLNHYWLF
ncbi:SubName: Full=Related to Cytochrome P450 {ECO:0000313/EMBL:CCA72147.1} [Serendipita indica DSM 11827]|nr:SubName: Full=Related to Cytochrome P450 {ECO:0000313/EMBL:CCA72147.1} [Serendipita indica DSM 11827]